jgi:hypothetical protein
MHEGLDELTLEQQKCDQKWGYCQQGASSDDRPFDT